MKRWFAKGMVLAALHGLGGLAWAQSPAPLPNPNLPLVTNGIVNAIAAQPDGGVVFGGSFTSVNGVTRANLARLKPDGTLDANWNPAPNNTVYALAVDAANGAVYAGGSFTTIGTGAVARNRVAKLAADGSVDASWNPNAAGSVNALALNASGEVYAGGSFTTIGGLTRNRIAKIAGSGAGAVDANWDPNASTSFSSVNALAVNSAGDVYAGGSFTTIGGLTRNRIAKIAGGGTGTVDANWDPNSPSTVYTLAVNAGGDVYVGGGFTSIGGATRYFIAKLAGGGTGTADPNWKSFAGGYVSAIALDAAGNVIATGGFTNAATVLGAGQPRNYIARFAGSDGTLDGWNPSLGGIPNAVAVSQNGTVYTGGKFPTVGALPRLSFAGIDAATGIATAAVDAEAPATVNALVRQPNGGIVAGGDFLKSGADSRPYILRLQADGTLDPNWHPAVNGTISALAANAAGDIYAGGFFGSIDGVTRTYIAKLAGNSGTVDATWNPNSNGSVNALAVGADGSVYVGGSPFSFSTIGGQSRTNLAKLSGGGNGDADASWNPAPNNAVYALAADGGGNLFVGGDFTTIGAQSRNRIAKLGSDGSTDANWNPGANSTVYALTLDAAHGTVYAGGQFSVIGTPAPVPAHPRVARLAQTATGAVDAAWAPTTAGGTVRSIALGADGSVFVGGSLSWSGHAALAKLMPADGSFNPYWNPSANNTVYALLAAPNDTLYAGGMFAVIGGAQRNMLAALGGTVTRVVTPATSGDDGDPGNTISPAVPQTIAAGATTQFTVGIAANYSVAVADNCGSGGASNGSFDPGTGIYTTGTITADCTVTASYTALPIDGVCGGSNGQTFNAAPTTDLCSAGAASAVTGSGHPWNWTCNGTGVHQGTPANCSAIIQTWTVTPGVGAGGGGSIDPSPAQVVDNGGSFTFTASPAQDYFFSGVSGNCNTHVAGNDIIVSPVTASCNVIANFTPDPVDGACGSANGQTFTAVPNANLCSAGTASAVTGNGHPWNWSCGGGNGGGNANCSATIQTWTVGTAPGTGGNLSPTSRTVDHGATTTFTLVPDVGYGIGGASGCGGSLSGNLYTTAAIESACTVAASFVPTARPTSTSLASAPNPSTTTQSVVFTASIADLGGQAQGARPAASAAVAAAVAAGTVTIIDAYGGPNATTLCTAVVSAGSASCTAAPLAAGSHVVTALFADASGQYQSSQGSAVQAVLPPAGAATVSAPLGAWAWWSIILAIVAGAIRRFARSAAASD